MKKQLENKKIQCRLCKGPHFTTKCPYKDSLGSLGLGGGAYHELSFAEMTLT